MASIQRQALAEQTTRSGDVELIEGQHAGPVEHPGAGQRRCVCSAEGEQGSDATTSLGEKAVHLPQVPDHAGQAERPLGVDLAQEPVQGRIKFGLLYREAVRPATGVELRLGRLGVLGEGEKVGGVLIVQLSGAMKAIRSPAGANRG